MSIWKCNICRGPGEKISDRELDCFRCGRYKATDDSFLFAKNNNLSSRQIANASAWLFRNQGLTLDGKMLSFLGELATPSMGERADGLLSYLSNRYPDAGRAFLVSYWQLDALLKAITDWKDDHSFDPQAAKYAKDILPFLSAAWADSQRELEFLLVGFLKDHAGFLAKGPMDGSLEITPRGWDRLYALKHILQKSDEAFVAMWFDPSMNSLWADALAPGIQAAGYKAVRIDKKEHLNKIDDEIVAAIRRAKFLVTDFTGQRGGVYFEAGLATGLGKPVVWICREDELPNIHFDNRQYNFLTWTPDKLPELKRILQNRIEAVIGRGSSGVD